MKAAVCFLLWAELGRFSFKQLSVPWQLVNFQARVNFKVSPFIE